MNTIRSVLYVGCLGILVACGGSGEPSVRQSLTGVAPVEYEDGSQLTHLAGFRVWSLDMGRIWLQPASVRDVFQSFAQNRTLCDKRDLNI